MPSTLTFITESLPDFTQNTPAGFQIEAVGGTPPYNFQITQGALPPGLSLSQPGVITGTPTQVADTTAFVRLSDAANVSVTQAFAARVVPGEPGGGDGGNSGGGGGCLSLLMKLFPPRRPAPTAGPKW
jgi:hypothetical protein